MTLPDRKKTPTTCYNSKVTHVFAELEQRAAPQSHQTAGGLGLCRHQYSDGIVSESGRGRCQVVLTFARNCVNGTSRIFPSKRPLDLDNVQATEGVDRLVQKTRCKGAATQHCCQVAGSGLVADRDTHARGFRTKLPDGPAGRCRSSRERRANIACGVDRARVCRASCHVHMPEAPQQLGTQDRVYAAPKARKTEAPTLAFQVLMRDTSVERQHDIDCFIWALTKTITTAHPSFVSGPDPHDLAAIAARSLPRSTELFPQPPGTHPCSPVTSTFFRLDGTTPSPGSRSWRDTPGSQVSAARHGHTFQTRRQERHCVGP